MVEILGLQCDTVQKSNIENTTFVCFTNIAPSNSAVIVFYPFPVAVAKLSGTFM